jgi:hypothetical protein
LQPPDGPWQFLLVGEAHLLLVLHQFLRGELLPPCIEIVFRNLIQDVVAVTSTLPYI